MSKLEKYILQIRGVSYKPIDSSDIKKDGYIPLLRANNIKDGKINYDNLIYVKEEKVKENQFLKKGDILICTSNGSKELVGKAGLIKEDIRATFGAFCRVIRLKKDINYQYLIHFFHSNYYREIIKKKSNGANINNLKNEDIDSLDIKIIDNKEQLKIANELDRIVDIINIKENQTRKLNELIESKFVKMFENENYPKKCLNEVCEQLFAGGDVKKEHTAKEKTDKFKYPIYTNGEKLDGLYGYTDIARVCKEAVTISGRGTIGFSCIRKEPFYPAVRLIVVVPDKKIINTTYLRQFIKNKNYGGQGAGIPQLTVPMIKNEQIPIPPIELQEKFADFVKQIDKQKENCIKIIAKLNELKESKMQEYFGGVVNE